MSQAEVLTRVENGVGRITLNRPRAIHALNRSMCEMMTEALLAWRSNPSVSSILIDHAVRSEGPILERVLSRRIARAHGWQRTGARIHERVMQIALARQRNESDEEERCFWPASIDAPSCRFRHPRPGESRDVDDIPRAELVALAREIIGAGRGIGAEAGIEAMLRHIGMRRARAATKEKLAVVWDEANGMTAQFRAE